MTQPMNENREQADDCPNPWVHSVNGGPMRYCLCGWIEDVTPTPDVLATTWAEGHSYRPRADEGFGCERCGRGPSAPVHHRDESSVVVR